MRDITNMELCQAFFIQLLLLGEKGGCPQRAGENLGWVEGNQRGVIWWV
jgi:hypothetical protein